MRLRFDPLAWEYEEFKMQLDQVLVPFHEAAIIELQKIHSEKEEALREAMSEPAKLGDEGEWQLQRDYQRLEGQIAKERERLSGWLALVYLVIILDLKLEKLKSLLDESRPPTGKYQGKSQLERTIDEYQKRFDIHLESHPNFPFIRELVLARNAVVHNAGKPTNDYLKLPNPHFLDKIEKVEFVHLTELHLIVFSNQHFKESLRHLEEFMDWLVRALIYVRSGHRPVGPLRGSQFVP
jgi:hypothetical protein